MVAAADVMLVAEVAAAAVVAATEIEEATTGEVGVAIAGAVVSAGAAIARVCELLLTIPPCTAKAAAKVNLTHPTIIQSHRR